MKGEPVVLFAWLLFTDLLKTAECVCVCVGVCVAPVCVHDSVHVRVPELTDLSTRDDVDLFTYTNRRQWDGFRSPGRHGLLHMKLKSENKLICIHPKIDQLHVCHWLWITLRLVPHCRTSCLPCLFTMLYLLLYFPQRYPCWCDWPKATGLLWSDCISAFASSLIKHGFNKRRTWGRCFGSSPGKREEQATGSFHFQTACRRICILKSDQIWRRKPRNQPSLSLPALKRILSLELHLMKTWPHSQRCIEKNNNPGRWYLNATNVPSFHHNSCPDSMKLHTLSRNKLPEGNNDVPFIAH